MNAEETAPNRSLGLWVVLLLTVLGWAPATYPGYWQSLTGFAPIFNTRYPGPLADIATIADLWRGTGSAAFLLPHAMTQLGLSATVSVRLTFILSLIVGSVGIYIWLRPRYDDAAAGLAGLIYGLMPPLLNTIYVRGSLADALVLGLLPLVLAGLAHYRLSRSPAAVGVAAIALLWLWRTQAGLAVFCSLLVLLYVLLVERDRLAALAVFVTSAAGLLSLVPLWGVQGPAPVAFQQHALSLYQLLTGAGRADIAFLLGFVPLGFSLVALWLWWMRSRTGTEAETPDSLPLLPEQQRFLRFCFIAVMVAIVLSLGIALPLWQWTGAQRLLTYPWQILLPVLPLLAACAGSLLWLSPGLSARGIWAGTLGLVVLGSLPYLTPSFTQYTAPDVPVAVFGESADLVLLEADLRETSMDEQGQALLSATWQPLHPLSVDYNLFFQALDATDDQYTVVAQLDQQPLAEQPATTWQPGTIFTATYQLDLPVDPNQANLRYYVGYYDWRDGTRLPLTSGTDDKVILYGE